MTPDVSYFEMGPAMSMPLGLSYLSYSAGIFKSMGTDLKAGFKLRP